MAWIDYRKAHNMIPHSWITECMEMTGAASNIRSFVQKTMPHWRTKLIVRNQELGEVKIERGLFQGDRLSSLLFVIGMIPMILLFRSCKAKYHLGKEYPKLNNQLFMDDLKLFGKCSKETDSLIRTVFVFSQDR